MFENVDSDWIKQGKCEYMLERDVFRIFPKRDDGKTIPIWIRRVYVHIRRKWNSDHYTQITFKYYKHRRNYYWRDERKPKEGSCSRFHVRDELARILFEKDKEQAQRLMAQVMSMI